MNRQELIETIATEHELTKADAGRILETLLDTIIKAVAKDDGLTLPGFGSFKKVTRAARMGFNPQAGKPLKIAAKTIPKFSPGSKFKDAVDAKVAKKRAAAKKAK